VTDPSALREAIGRHGCSCPQVHVGQFLVGGLVGDRERPGIDRWIRRVVQILAGTEGPFDFYGFDYVFLDLAHDLASYQGELMTEGQAEALAAWLDSRYSGSLASVLPERVEYVDPDGLVSIHDSSASWMLHQDPGWSLPFLAGATTYSVQLAPQSPGPTGQGVAADA
jgi:hypothetical protein